MVCGQELQSSCTGLRCVSAAAAVEASAGERGATAPVDLEALTSSAAEEEEAAASAVEGAAAAAALPGGGYSGPGG